MSSQELDLFVTAARTAEVRLRRLLTENCHCRVDLVFTRNRVSMVSLKFMHERLVRLRLHEKFLYAPTDVWEAIARYIRSRRRQDWNIVSEYAAGIDVSAESDDASSLRLLQKGRVYNLEQIARDVNRMYFQGRVKYKIGWGKARPERRRRHRGGKSIRYGSWTAATGVIRIHPLLDDERVPQRFVEYVVFHEMLHAVVPDECKGGRRYCHTATFRAFERTFPAIDEMYVLAEKLLHELC